MAKADVLSSVIIAIALGVIKIGNIAHRVEIKQVSVLTNHHLPDVTSLPTLIIWLCGSLPERSLQTTTDVNLEL